MPEFVKIACGATGDRVTVEGVTNGAGKRKVTVEIRAAGGAVLSAWMDAQERDQLAKALEQTRTWLPSVTACCSCGEAIDGKPSAHIIDSRGVHQPLCVTCDPLAPMPVAGR